MKLQAVMAALLGEVIITVPGLLGSKEVHLHIHIPASEKGKEAAPSAFKGHQEVTQVTSAYIVMTRTTCHME